MSLIPAAVLVPIIKRKNELTVLYTVRSQHVSNHKGQISFPGGLVEKQDHDKRATALREAHEEINLCPTTVKTLGYLPQIVSISGFEITPVVGLIESTANNLQADPKEVAEIFEVPLSYILNRNHHQTTPSFGGIVPQEERHHHSCIRFEDYAIWGVTADITMMLDTFLESHDTFLELVSKVNA